MRLNQTSSYLKKELERIKKELLEVKTSLSDPELKNLAKQEIEKLNNQKDSIQKAIKQEKNIKKKKQPKTDFGNIILEIRAGTGGQEAKIWANDLLEMYIRFANQKGLEIIKLGENIIKIKNKKAHSFFRFEAGIHRVQRIPETESRGRVHTSTASVAILPEVKSEQIQINKKDIRTEFFRSSGAGGQNVNKLSTAVRIVHKPTKITVECQTQRYQKQNREIALEHLRTKLYQKQQKEKQEKLGKLRRKAIGQAKRAEKIRTYNYPQNRVTDHRIKKSWKNLDNIMQGNLTQVVKALSISSLT